MGSLLAFFALLVLLGLSVPFDLTFRLYRERRMVVRARFEFLFGAVRLPVAWPARGRGRDQRSRPGSKRNTPLRPGSESATHGSRLLDPGNAALVFRVLRKLARCVTVRQLRLNARFGLQDPADTGRVWGLLASGIRAVPLPAVAEVCIEPDFEQAVFQVDIGGRLRILPIQVLMILLASVMAPSTWRALRPHGNSR